MKKKTIGIIGGMGPAATCDLMQKIIRITPAAKDQDHIHMVVDCNTEIPDRTSAILQHTQSPVPQMVRSGILLQAMGADVLIMPCNTAHFFYDQLTPFFDVPLLHMIRETAEELKRQGISRAGLLATDGTVQSGVYAKVMEEADIELLTPDETGQQSVMELIYKGVKAGRNDFPTDSFEKTMKNLLDRAVRN